MSAFAAFPPMDALKAALIGDDALALPVAKRMRAVYYLRSIADLADLTLTGAPTDKSSSAAEGESEGIHAIRIQFAHRKSFAIKGHRAADLLTRDEWLWWKAHFHISDPRVAPKFGTRAWTMVLSSLN